MVPVNNQQPNMSKHLWLYEGVTEYLSKLIELKGELTDLNTFLNYLMRPKTGENF